MLIYSGTLEVDIKGSKKYTCYMPGCKVIFGKRVCVPGEYESDKPCSESGGYGTPQEACRHSRC